VVRLGMECYRLTYSLGSMLAQNCHKKTALKAKSCVDRACRCRRCFNMRQTPCVQGAALTLPTSRRASFSLYSTPRTFTITRLGRCPSNSA
jgi:hypothetical protein